MLKINPLLSLAAVALAGLFASAAQTRAADAIEDRKPNIIWIMADDLGYGDLGCFGQKLTKTPNLDKMALEGTKFTNVYSGSTVCAPSRCVLMTGLHTGHCRIRGNARLPLEPDDVTVAEVLKSAGYATALCGKWGLGEAESTGVPNKQGFDYFYGYLNQHHAHNYYPDFLWRNETRIKLRNVVAPHANPEKAQNDGEFGANWSTKRIDYSHDLVMSEAYAWIHQQVRKSAKPSPFFLYLALTIPHANNEGTRGTGNGQEVPDLGIYKDEPWSEQNKGQAAMITRMDADIGKLFALLKELKIDGHTLVIFTSDNGPHREGGNDPKLFNPSGDLRGMKRDLYEGGIRVPTIARWPGVVPAGKTNDTPWMFMDLLPTAAELAGIPKDQLPKPLDGRSIVPLLKGEDAPGDLTDRHLYWEFYEGPFAQAVRKGKWKAVRKGFEKGDIELFDLSADNSEKSNVAADHPDIVATMKQIMASEHTPDANWKMRVK